LRSSVTKELGRDELRRAKRKRKQMESDEKDAELLLLSF
jgi:hypothetical protein